MYNRNIKKFLVNKNVSIKRAMRKIDRGGLGIVFLVDDKEGLFGVIADGDIRRAILEGVNIKSPVKTITNRKPVVLHEKFGEEEILELKRNKEVKKRIPIKGSLKIPVIDDKNRVKDIVFLYSNGENIGFSSKKKLKHNQETVKKVLAIGGAGYLGSVLCRKLLERGYQVRVLDNLTYGDYGIKELLKNKRFEFIKGDIRNISDIVEATKGVDAVIHLAAIVGDPACAINPRETLEINYLATKNITEICKYFQINRFIFASTCSVYGKSYSQNKKLTEESQLQPLSLYAETKIKCEQSILESIDENFSPVILRMATLYGYSPLMRFDLVVNLLTAKAIFEKEITIFGGQQQRPWLHLEDAVGAYIKCLESPVSKIRRGIFNVLSENYKIIEVGKIINSIFPKAKIKIQKQVTDQRDYNVSYDKILKILNFRPQKRISEGVVEIKNAINKGIKNYKDPRYRFSLPQI